MTKHLSDDINADIKDRSAKINAEELQIANEELAEYDNEVMKLRKEVHELLKERHDMRVALNTLIRVMGKKDLNQSEINLVSAAKDLLVKYYRLTDILR
jgi:cell division GTPase FtsZ